MSLGSLSFLYGVLRLHLRLHFTYSSTHISIVLVCKKSVLQLAGVCTVLPYYSCMYEHAIDAFVVREVICEVKKHGTKIKSM